MNTKPSPSTGAASAKPAEAIDISSDESQSENARDVMKEEERQNQEAATASQKRHGKMNDELPYKKRKSDDTLPRTIFETQKQHLHTPPTLANQRSPNAGTRGCSSKMYPLTRKYKINVDVRKSREDFHDIGGMEKILKELCDLLIPLNCHEFYFNLGLTPPLGILLHGPIGCGKTLLARCIAGELNWPIIEVPATELIGGFPGESEERIRDLFEQARVCAPCVLFIDDIDTISSNRVMGQKDRERRIVSQLISCMDELKAMEDIEDVLVVGATSRPDVLDPALRRYGRFDNEIAIGIPNRKDRKDILKILCGNLSIAPGIDFDKIAELTPGYVGADIANLVTRAASIAIKRRYTEQIHDIQVNRNVSFVDLDADDADETDCSNTKSSQEHKEKEFSKITDGNTSSIAGERRFSKENDAKEAKASTKKQAEATEVEEEQLDTDNPASKNGAYSDKAEAMIEANCTEDSAKRVDSNIEKTNKTELATAEPSLLELLKYFKNPPEYTSLTEKHCLTTDDFLQAVKVVLPTAQREGFITVPDVTWDDIGSLHDIRKELKLAFLTPVKFSDRMARFSLPAPSGVLLCGPPGCGKTLVAKAIANEAGINFISVKGPELLNMYVGESERAVRSCFQRARNSAPCVIFFDEFDSLCPKPSNSGDNSSGTRIINQLLIEMDSIQDRRGVYILVASNRPDIIDPSILRPGRLDTILYVGLPEKNERQDILKTQIKHGKSLVLADDIDLEMLAEKTEGFSGADLAGLIRQASMLALQDSSMDDNDLWLRKEDFEIALQKIKPSVSAQDRKIYENLRLQYASPCAPVPSTNSTN